MRPNYYDVRGAVECYGVGAVVAGTAEAGGPEETRSSAIELCHECIPTRTRQETGRAADGEIERVRFAADIGASLGVQCDSEGPVLSAASDAGETERLVRARGRQRQEGGP